MQQSLTVVLERNALLTGEFATEPYEVAWAREARWFVRVLNKDLMRESRMQVATQISPDGLNWCTLDGSERTVGPESVTSWADREFGGWLRLKGIVTNAETTDTDPGMKVIIYLTLKS